jgi:hypothetical protein
VCGRLAAEGADDATVAAGFVVVVWTVAGGVMAGCWVTGCCVVFGSLVVGEELLVGAASGLTCGAGSGLGEVAANACGASTSDQAKMTALHPAGSPPRLRLDGAGADCAATLQVTATPDLKSVYLKPK